MSFLDFILNVSIETLNNISTLVITKNKYVNFKMSINNVGTYNRLSTFSNTYFDT